MPIKPENKHLYPPDWPEIRYRILQRARHECEWPGCRALHHSVGRWIPAGKGWQFKTIGGKAGRGQLSFSRAQIAASRERMRDQHGRAVIVIVLTIAHLDHNPANCDDANLRAWCQRHHLAYDQQHHLQTAYMGRLAARNNLELEFACRS